MSIIIKTPTQIDGIRKSCQLAAATLKLIDQHVVAGVTTGELNDLMEDYIRQHDGIPAPLGYNGYPKATCISINNVVCHGIPGNYILNTGDIVNIDVSTILHGYYGDTATMFAIPPISEDAQHLLDVAKKCLEIGIRQVKPGNYFGNIGYEIGRYAHLQDCSVVEDYTGHGVGIEFHEDPQIHHIAPKDSGPIMLPGIIFTVEPMINIKGPEVVILEDGWTAVTKDGSLSAQYEHTLLVNTEGCEILTR